MTIDIDLDRIALQEAELQFDSFDLNTAWDLGTRLRSLCAERGYGVAIEIYLVSVPVFHTALPGATPDNPNWIRRKRNLVMRLFRSSYATGLSLTQQGKTLQEKLGLGDADYAPHGGSFPIVVKGTGCIGAVTVSGLPQRLDHCVVVEVLAGMLGKHHALLSLDQD